MNILHPDVGLTPGKNGYSALVCLLFCAPLPVLLRAALRHSKAHSASPCKRTADRVACA
jgi:hypothetical protein